jgi:hypothetical protein
MTQRWLRYAPALLFPLALIVCLVHSRAVAPAFDELPRLSAILRAQAVVHSVAEAGPAALGDAASRASFTSSGHSGSFGHLLSAWARLSIGRVGLLDPLTSARLPVLLLASAVPFALFLMLRAGGGNRAAWFSAVLLFTFERFWHGAAVQARSVAAAAIWMLALVVYVQSLRGRAGTLRVAPWCWSAALAVVLGVGWSIDRASLWVVPVILVHYPIARWPLFRRAAPSLVPLHSGLVMTAAAVPIATLLLHPGLWGENATALARWVLTTLTPQVAPASYEGSVIAAPPLPLGFAWVWFTRTTPLVLTLLAFAGVVALGHTFLARRFASGRLRPRRDPTAIGALLLLGAALTLLGTSLVPAPLRVFPPFVEAALPFTAALAGIGLDAALRWTGERRAGYAAAAAIVLVLLSVSFRAPSTASAAFDAVPGGTRRVAAGAILPLGDGSELSTVTAAIDRLGADVELIADDVPAEYWAIARQFERMTASVRETPDAPLELVRAEHMPAVRAQVRRDGVVLWSLGPRR